MTDPFYQRITGIPVLCLLLFLVGCPGTDYGTDGCFRDDPPIVEDFWKGPGRRLCFSNPS